MHYHQQTKFYMQSIRMDTNKIYERSAWKIRNYLWINKDSMSKG